MMSLPTVSIFLCISLQLLVNNPDFATSIKELFEDIKEHYEHAS